MLLPIGDDNRGRMTTPVIVYMIVGINVGVFLVQWVLGEPFTLAYAAVPYEIIHNTDLVHRATLPGDIPQYPGPWPIQITLLTDVYARRHNAHRRQHALSLDIRR